MGENPEEKKQQTPNYSITAELHPPTLSKEQREMFGTSFGIFVVSIFVASIFLHSLRQFCCERFTIWFQLVEMLTFLPVIDGFNELMDDDDLPWELVSYFETQYTRERS